VTNIIINQNQINRSCKNEQEDQRAEHQRRFHSRKEMIHTQVRQELLQKQKLTDAF
jgi:hypothetical protein